MSRSRKSSQSKKMSPLYLVLLLLVAIGAYLYQGGYLEGLGLGPAGRVVSVSGEWYQVHFTTPDFTNQAPHTGGMDSLVIADIDAAQKSVDVASFEFNLESITEALIAAHKRGVQVRLVLDDGNLSQEEMDRLTGEMQRAGIPIAYDQRSAFMHNKFVVIDDLILWVGSWNLTINDTYRNNNNMLRLIIPQMAVNYRAEFEEMFVEGQFGPRSPADTPYPVLVLSDGSRIETYFSPEDKPREALIERLGRAEREILFMAFSFTDEEIGRVLLQKARAGVVVRGVFEARGAGSEYSEYSKMRQAGLEVRLDGNPRTMHHKVFIIDGVVTVTGSYNFSLNAAQSNDENVLIIENAEIAASYKQEFERVYRDGTE